MNEMTPSDHGSSAAAATEWRDIATAPKNGTPIVGAELYRYLPYKPEGVRQMKRHGRWQRWNGYGWDNSEPPESWMPAERIKHAAADRAT